MYHFIRPRYNLVHKQRTPIAISLRFPVRPRPGPARNALPPPGTRVHRAADMEPSETEAQYPTSKHLAGIGVALGSTSRLTVLSIALVALCVPLLQAKNLVIALDPAETKIAFTLSATLHAVHGTFRLQSGYVTFNPSTHIIGGEIIVGSASGESANAMRDGRMRQGVLQVQRYPEIRFSPAACSGPVAINGISRVEITGLLSIHGDAHRITIPVEVQWSGKKIITTGTFIVPYVKWGMENPSRFFLKVGQNVEIDFTAAGQVRQAEAE